MSNFVHPHKMSSDTIHHISARYKRITWAINREFWNSTSEIQHSLYVGSYGRNTAIETSDIDILVELPSELFDRYNYSMTGNVQSRLLQAVRSAIKSTYSNSDISADGQVVKINFTDEMYFEIVPAFKDEDNRYKYPDSNNGGRWRSTNPKAEQDAMTHKNKSSNGLLYDTCKHIRSIRDSSFSSYHLSGIVIDSFVYNAIGLWRWPYKGECLCTPSGRYEQALLDYYTQHGISKGDSISAPGSNDKVSTESSYECLGKVLKSMV